MVRFAHFESINGAFIYGVLGRPPVFGNPILKPATTLLSFPFKQAEFMRRTFKEDPTAMMRFIGMQSEAEVLAERPFAHPYYWAGFTLHLA